MADKPIIFSAPMVRALLDGRKTQTRRIIKDRGDLPQFCGGRFDDRNDPEAWGWEDHDRGEWITLDQWRRWTFVPYRPGNRLWVREGWVLDPWDNDAVTYRADGEAIYDNVRTRWKPSIHMPRWASRLTLVVTEVRVQRLADITLGDVAAEGIEGAREILDRAFISRGEELPFGKFRDLWNSLHGPEAWDANPWVCALTFTTHHTNIDSMEILNGKL